MLLKFVQPTQCVVPGHPGDAPFVFRIVAELSPCLFCLCSSGLGPIHLSAINGGSPRSSIDGAIVDGHDNDSGFLP